MSYIFDPRRDTLEGIRRKREIAASLLLGNSRPARNVGEGLVALGNGILGGVLYRQSLQAEEAARAHARDQLSALYGGGENPPAEDENQPFLGGVPVGNVERSALTPDERVVQAHDVASGDPTVDLMSAYIKEAAASRGIDPDVALRVARSEGLAPGVWQSNVINKQGRRETSYGPFQLLVGGGLGDEFQRRYGKSPADKSTWREQIDFALDEAAKGGWSPWYGAAKVGVDARTGLENARPLGTMTAYAPTTPQPHALAAGGNLMGEVGPNDPGIWGGGMDPNNPATIPAMAGGTRDVLSNPTGYFPPAPGQGSTGPTVQQLLDIMGNPFQPQEVREYAAKLLDLRHQQPKKAPLINAGDGRIFDPNNGQWIMAPNIGQTGFRQATPEEAAAYGAVGGQFGPDGRFYPINPPSGMTVESDGQGGFRIVQGPGAGAGGRLTEGQSKDITYATRAEGALPILDRFDAYLTSPIDRAYENDPTGLLRGRQSPEFQQAYNAGLEFLQAILRKDTGAAITKEETEEYGRVYLPQPGDSETVLLQKRLARSRALQALKAGMPPEAILRTERALEGSTSGGLLPEGATEEDIQYTMQKYGLTREEVLQRLSE